MCNWNEVDLFLDICTQQDYLDDAGCALVPNANQVRSNVKHLMAFARWSHFPTLSCVDEAWGMNPNGGQAPVSKGSPVEKKISFSVLPDHTSIESDNCLCISLDIFDRYQQAILTKSHDDPFTNPKIDRLLTEVPARRYVIFGIALEQEVRLLTLGLMLRGRKVVVIADACGYHSTEGADMALRQLGAKGCELVSTQEFIESRMAKLRARTNRRRSVA